MEQLREGLRQPVCEGRCHDRTVVVVVGHERGPQLFQTDTGRHREQADVIRHTGPDGCRVVGKCHVRAAVRLAHLLPQGM